MKRILVTLTVFFAAAGAACADDITFLPPPFCDDALPPPPPSLFFNLEFAAVQPRLRGSDGNSAGSLAFSSRLDWTISPRFEIGFTNGDRWNPYLGYRNVYSDKGQSTLDPITDTLLLFSRSTDLHVLDLGMRSSPFCLLSVLQAEWDLSARISVLDFHDHYDFDFTDGSFILATIRQQFVGAGPRGGLRLALPLADTGFALGARFDAGLQWGGYRNQADLAEFDGVDLVEERDCRKKGGLLWHTGAQVAVHYAWPAHEPRLISSLGYLYEGWFSKDLGFLDGGTRGHFDYHGPFVRVEWKF